MLFLYLPADLIIKVQSFGVLFFLHSFLFPAFYCLQPVLGSIQQQRFSYQELFIIFSVLAKHTLPARKQIQGR